MEFTHLRALVTTSVGDLVLRDRFVPPKGETAPWAVFSIEDGVGEKAEETAEPKGRKVRRTYVIYIYARDNMIWADFDGEGKLVRMARAQGTAVTLDHTKERKKGGPYGIWAEMKHPIQTDGSKLPECPTARKDLLEALMITRYESGSVFRIKHFDKDGRETKTVYAKFSALPFDASFDKAAVADKQSWK